MGWMHLTIERDVLYGEVWEEPVQVVARRYRMSGTALKKICRKLSVPTPPNGYWARKAAGQSVVRPELPKLARGAPDRHQVSLQETEWGDGSFSPAVRSALERERTVGAEISVSEELANPHPLVSSATRLLKRAGLKARAEILATIKCLDIVVSPAQLDRALRIMDALLKALEARGFEVEVTEAIAPKPPQPVHLYESHLYKSSRTGVHIGEAFVEFALEELQDVVWPHGKRPPSDEVEKWLKWKMGRSGPDSEHRPSGRLGLKLTSYTFLGPPRQSWRDGKTQRVENMLNEFVAAIMDIAERHRLWAELRAREERERAEAKRREEEEAARRKIERGLQADLRRRTMRWCRARDIDELLAAFEKVHGEGGDTTWAQWARAEAKRLRDAALSAPAMLEADGPDADH